MNQETENQIKYNLNSFSLFQIATYVYSSLVSINSKVINCQKKPTT